jgi:hypothetical protein
MDTQARVHVLQGLSDLNDVLCAQSLIDYFVPSLVEDVSAHCKFENEINVVIIVEIAKEANNIRVLQL